ncbi:MAG: hypothetical protein ACI9DG_000640 [Oleispira sp.]|jgi:hypothetical protein
MKELLRKAFSPILENFESGTEKYIYKKSHRVILIVMSVIFAILSTAVAVMAAEADSAGYYIPVFIFGLVSLVTLVVGALGNERAVSSIWGNK